jgi:hypothetical protein
MSINMKVGIGFYIIFNNTEKEWHELQLSLAERIKNKTLHCLPTSFNADPSFSINCIDFVVDYHYRLKDLHIECICIQRPPVAVPKG